MSSTKTKDRASLPEEKPSDNTIQGAGTPQIPGDDAGTTGNIEQIRDILFGVQMRDYEERFARMEERMVTQVTDLRDETTKHFDSLENYIKKEVESLSDRLKTEQNNQAKLIKELSTGLKDTTASFEKKIRQLDGELDKTSRDFRQQILDQSKNLINEIHQKHEETSTAIAQAVQDLRSDKVSRSVLSQLFVDMGTRLGNDQTVKLNPESQDVENE
ncbi:MAG: hypothetical protein KAI35_06680 [Desulfobulbaceae bacterium]|nr:hypothetical protein [Desulfobulbaceae bacterium]